MAHILLLHVSAGMGHQRAAQAVARALAQQPHTTVEVADTLDYAHPLFQRGYPALSVGVADRVPALWDSFYHHTNHQHAPNGLLNTARRLSTALGVQRLTALLDRTQPDAIICTHFLPLEVLAPRRAAGLPPLACVVTDYRAHTFWAFAGADRYFVPNTTARDDLIAAHIPAAQVQVTGIPVDPAVRAPVDRLAVRRGLGLAAWQPLITLIGSGMSVARVRRLVAALLAQRLPATLLVAAGRNRELVAHLADLEQAAGDRLRVLGAQPSLDPLIASSALVIGKAGGLTTSEVLARGVPLIVALPVAGQEAWNADYIAHIGAGRCYARADDLAQGVAELLHDEPQRAGLAQAARGAGRPDAACQIAEWAVTHTQQAGSVVPLQAPLRPRVGSPLVAKHAMQVPHL